MKEIIFYATPYFLFILYLIIELIKKIIVTNASSKQVINSKDNIENIMTDLLVIVEYKCSNAYEKSIIPATERDLKQRKTISDETLNMISAEVTYEIISFLSDTYIRRISTIIKSDKIEQFILSLVYDTLSKLVIQLNKEILKQYK